MVAATDVRQALEEHPERWKLGIFRSSVSRPIDDGLGNIERAYIPPADHHTDFWRWVWSIRLGIIPDPDSYIGVWPRGGAKSTNVELAVAALGARQRRNYCLYVCGTQDQADDHVGNVQTLLENPQFGEIYPEVASRLIGNYGPKAWRRNRLQTASGFAVDAAGLDTAIRGMKLEDDRPDLIVIDDVDDVNDSASLSLKKLRTLTNTIFLAGAPSLTIIVIQNLVLRGGVIWNLVRNPQADVLANARISGPIPALRDFKAERDAQPREDGRGWVLTGGEPTWVGQNLADCQAMVDRVGLRAFVSECQQELDEVSDLVHAKFNPEVHRWIAKELPRFTRFIGGLDFGGEGESANESAGVLAGVTEDNRLVLISEWKDRGANVAERQMDWMSLVEASWCRRGQKVAWFADRTERVGIQLMRGSGFDIKSSLSGGEDNAGRETRVRAVGTRLVVRPDGHPGLYYMPRLLEWENEILHYRRVPANPNAQHDRRPIMRIDDHLMTATEYMVEGEDQRRAAGDDYNETAYQSVSW